MSSYLITAEWFPFSEENKVRDFADAVDGLISGEMRLLCHFGVFGGEPSSVELQRPSSGGWITIFRYGQAFAAPAFSTNAVFNQARASSS